MIAAYVVFLVAVAIACAYLGAIHLWLGRESDDKAPAAQPRPNPIGRDSRPSSLRAAHA